MRRIFLPGFVLGLGLARCEAAESAMPWRAISFEAAAPLAAQEEKIIFIEFHRAASEPCRRLETETWADAAVGKFLAEKTVALRLDAEQEGRALAQRFNITAHPTLLLLRPDGTELDRLVGFRAPEKFLREFATAAAGKTPLARGIEIVPHLPQIGAATVVRRYEQGRALAHSGQFAEALAELLWCYDEGLPAVPAFSEVRRDFLMGQIARVGGWHPEALEALRARRDAAERVMLGRATSRHATADFAALNLALGDNERTFSVLEAVPPGEARREAMADRIYEVFIRQRRYAVAAELRPPARMKQEFERSLGALAAMPADTPGDQAEAAVHALRAATVRDIEVLLGLGETDTARALADQLCEKIADASVSKSLLRSAALRAGHPQMFAE